MAKILVVEEHPDRADAIDRMLRFARHETDFVPDGQVALESLQDVGLPDVMIANIVLARVDGLTLCRTVKQTPALARLPVILIGEREGESGDESLAKRAGATAFIRRPLQRDHLLAEIDTALLTASFQDNPLGRYNPVEEVSFLRDYNTWLTRMLHQTTTQLGSTSAVLDLRDAHVYTINTLTMAIGENLNLQETLNRLVARTAEMMRAQAVAIYTCLEDQEFALGQVTAFGIPTPHLPRHHHLNDESPLYDLVHNNNALLFDTPGAILPLQEIFWLDAAIRSAIAAPLMAQSQLNGFLLALRTDAELPFNGQDADVLFSLSGAAGLALRSAQLFTELENAYQDLQELDRRKSEFVAITSHELRTPIAIMMGYASILQDAEEDPTKRQQLATIEKQAQFLSGMVDSLLNLHELTVDDKDKSVQLRCQVLRVDTLIQSAIEATREHNTYGKTVSFEVDCDAIELKGDEIRLLMVMNNLLDNAIKFTDGEVCTVTIWVAERPEGGVIITVKDHGIGIPPQYHEQIFEPFFQIEPAITRYHGGLGLGLAIVKGLVEVHGGAVEVVSRKGEGSRFIITLPYEPPPGRCLNLF